MICECCGKEILIKFASGRFCSRSCANSFSSRTNRAETNKKVSKALKGKIPVNGWSPKVLENRKNFGKISSDVRRKIIKQKIETSPWEELCLIHKRKRIEKEQDNKCLICGITDDWMEKKLKLQLDHIDGNSSNNSRENLRLLCPNCHSQTENFCGCKKTGRVSDNSLKELLLKNNFDIQRSLLEINHTFSQFNVNRCIRIIKTIGGLPGSG